MASKALIVLGFLLAALVLISSEVAARELAENAKEVETGKIRLSSFRKHASLSDAEEPVNDAKQYGGGGGGYGRPGYGYPPRGYPGRGYPGRGYPGGGCRRCCNYGPCRCCTEAELAALTAEEKPHN